MSQLRQYEQQLEATDASVCIVTFETPQRAIAYARETELPWPLLIDENRVLYEAFGMRRGRRWNLYGPASIWAYLKLFARGRRLRKPHDDIYQLGGDVLIDPEGIVRLHYMGVGPADRPKVSTLLDRVGVEQS